MAPPTAASGAGPRGVCIIDETLTFALLTEMRSGRLTNTGWTAWIIHALYFPSFDKVIRTRSVEARQAQNMTLYHTANANASHPRRGQASEVVLGNSASSLLTPSPPFK